MLAALVCEEDGIDSETTFAGDDSPAERREPVDVDVAEAEE